MDNREGDRYTYEDAGFNSFLSRALSAKVVNNLHALTQSGTSLELNFDRYQTSGSLGDKIQVGGITIDGSNRRIVILDELRTEVGWIGLLR